MKTENMSEYKVGNNANPFLSQVYTMMRKVYPVYFLLLPTLQNYQTKLF